MQILHVEKILSFPINFQNAKLICCHLVADYTTNLYYKFTYRNVWKTSQFASSNNPYRTTKTCQFWSDLKLQYTVVIFYILVLL